MVHARSFRGLACATVVAAALAVSGPAAAGEESPPSDPRLTPLVELIGRCMPSAVYFTVYNSPGAIGGETVTCGGAVIREDGYLLTSAMVVDGDSNFVKLYEGKEMPYRVVGRLPEYDLALVKAEAGRALKPVVFGRSNNLVLGEPVLAAGNPSLWSHTVSEGIISRLGPELEHRGLVQTSAGTSRGFEGGPLWNARGEFVGQITGDDEMTMNRRLQQVGVARTVDSIRWVFPKLIEAADECLFRPGVAVDMLAPEARVVAVARGSAAETAGLRPGNVITRVGDTPVRNGIDYHLALVGCDPGTAVPVEIARGSRTVTLTMMPDEAVLPPGKPVEGLVNGLNYGVYEGEWNALPDFSRLQAVSSGVTNAFRADVRPERTERFGLQFTGCFQAARAGTYRFSVVSDDGSRLWVGDRLVVDNDGLHVKTKRTGMVRLEAGLYGIRLDYFQGPGAKDLAVYWQGPGFNWQEIAEDDLFVARGSP